MNTAYGVASDRPWNRDLPDRLEKRLDGSFIPIRRREQMEAEWIADRDIGTIFVPHWSHIIPPEVFERFECIIFHMTDVPYGRGGSPLQNLIVRGHKETVMSAIRCLEELDAGPVYLKRPLSLYGTAEEIFLRADALIEEMIVELIQNPRKPQPQTGEVTTFKRRKPEDGDWSEASSLQEVFDWIRMLDAEGYPPAFVRVGPWKLFFTRANLTTDAVFADVRIEFSPEAERS